MRELFKFGGDIGIGESMQESIQIRGKDGSIFAVRVHRGVNLTTDPDLRQPLVEGSLNIVQGPDGDVYRPAVPLWVHDESARRFTLVIPEALRHCELALRADLLRALADTSQLLPDYVHDFDVLFDPAELDRPAGAAGVAGPQEATVITEAPTAPADSELRARLEQKEERLQKLQREADERQLRFERERKEFEERLEKMESKLASHRAGDGEFDDLIAELEEEQKQLEIDRQQLEEVASRVERDSARVEEAMNDIQRQRAELDEEREKLEEERRKLQVQQLNLQQEQIRLQNTGSAGDKPYANESTQVVTDDQFIEIVDAEDDEPRASTSNPARRAGAGPLRPEPTSVTFVSFESDEIPDDFSQAARGDTDYFVEATSGLIVAGFRLDDERAQSFLDLKPRFLFQVHEVEEVPVIALTLALFDEQGECVDAVAAPLTDSDERERALLDRFARDLHLHIAIYGSDGQRLASWEAGAPIRHNIGWARRRLRQWREGNDDPQGIARAAARLDDEDFELVGSMHHPFESDSFANFEGVSDVQLAVSIVGYWSETEQFRYLIENRSFSLGSFRQIQKRVVRQALHWGIALGDALRQVALDEAIILDNESLVERLLSNFAEVCVGLRPNDFDPLEQWENWEALINLAKRFHVTPDADVLELAEVSLKRAEEYDEVFDEGDSVLDGLSASGAEEFGQDNVASHRAEEAGVTYFLPDDYDRGEEGFDLMLSADVERLHELLQDPERRLMAAQAYLEKFGAQAVTDVLEVAEELNAVEQKALARFVEARADGLEAVLMQSIDGCGPAGVLVAARGLVSLQSAAAIPRLLEAVVDPQRQGDLQALASVLARFGDKLMPPLSKSLKERPGDESLLTVLAALESVRSGTIDELSSERNEQLNEAARLAREMV